LKLHLEFLNNLLKNSAFEISFPAIHST